MQIHSVGVLDYLPESCHCLHGNILISYNHTYVLEQSTSGIQIVHYTIVFVEILLLL